MEHGWPTLFQDLLFSFLHIPFSFLNCFKLPEILKCAQNSWLRIETLILRFNSMVTKIQYIGDEKELCVSSHFCLSLNLKDLLDLMADMHFSAANCGPLAHIIQRVASNHG